MNPFIVCTLSRSRTRWLAELLTLLGWTCHCEVAIGMREVDDIARFFGRGYTGTAETAVAPGWELLRHYVPDIRGVVVRRPVEDAIASMRAALAGVVTYDPDALRRNISAGARALDRMARTPGVLSVEFADLEREDVCAAIFQHCLSLPMPHEHWAALRGRNIQVNVRSMFDYYERNRVGIDGFKLACKADLRAQARAGAISRSGHI
jgi:hypothetical protein